MLTFISLLLSSLPSLWRLSLECAGTIDLTALACRAKYERDWLSPNGRTAQIATAMYFIDILALRAGHEKDEEEADTVGCCNLKVCG